MIHLLAGSLPSGFPHTTRSLLFQISPSTACPDLVPQLLLRPLQDWPRQSASITSPAPGHRQEVSGPSSGPLTTGCIPLSPLYTFGQRRPLDSQTLPQGYFIVTPFRQAPRTAHSMLSSFSTGPQASTNQMQSLLTLTWKAHGSPLLLLMTAPPTKETNACSEPTWLEVEQQLSQVRAL